MPSAVPVTWLLTGAVIIAAAIAADRMLARLAVRRVARYIAAVSNAKSAPTVRIVSVPFTTQLIGGVYREIEVTLAAFTVGGLDFRGLTASLTAVQAPLRRLLAGGGLIAGRMSCTATIPLAALGSRLPAGLTLRQHGGELAISGWILMVPVSGTLAIRADERRISVIPKVAGVPSLVGFVIDLPALPPELKIDAVLITDDGLEVTMQGEEVRLAGSTGPEALSRKTPGRGTLNRGTPNRGTLNRKRRRGVN